MHRTGVGLTLAKPPVRERSPATDDPRGWVSPDDRNVAPELLGAPLARPMRRLLAIGIDVAILAVLPDFGNVGLGLFAPVAANAPAEAASRAPVQAGRGDRPAP